MISTKNQCPRCCGPLILPAKSGVCLQCRREPNVHDEEIVLLDEDYQECSDQEHQEYSGVFGEGVAP